MARQVQPDSLRVLGSVGEPLNPEAFEWFYHVIGKDRCPIVDTWWQTETGMHMVTTVLGEPMRPGYVGKSIPGIVADVVDKDGKSVETGEERISRDPAAMACHDADDLEQRRTVPQYWETIPGRYQVGDLAIKGEDGYIMVIGRSDDLIIVSCHNIGTAEVESALVSHKAVAEAAVIGKPDPLKGNTIKAFVTLRIGHTPSEKLKNGLIYHVRITLGPIAMPSEIEFTDSLPKTRSGKIVRRILKAKEMGMDPGDISTLDD